MPSRTQLDAFKNSFKNVGNEALVVGNVEDYELPENEPPTPFPEGLGGEFEPAPAKEAVPEPAPDANDLGLDLPPESFPDTADSGLDFGGDLSDLLGSGLDDLGLGAAPETPPLDETTDDSFELPAETEMPEPGGLPADEEIPETAGTPAGEGAASGGEPDDLGEDFSSDLEFPEDAAVPEAGGADDSFGRQGAEDLGDGGSETADFDLGQDFDTAGIDLGGETAESPESGDSDGDFGADLDIPEFEDNFAGAGADSGDETAEGFDSGDSTGGFDTGFDAEAGTPDSAPDSEPSADSFAEDDSKAAETRPEDAPDTSTPSADDFGEFSLSGFDDAAKPGKAAAAAGKDVPEVEEIRLDEKEFQQLQETLSNYPLNLRIACEELIAEQAVDPAKMSVLIKLLTRGAPPKETASLVGKIMGKTIPIPKGYVKQTGEELEAEQASFGYIFSHRFLPVLRLAGLIALVAGSLGYLIWHFAVIPLQAEKRYKEGYNLILSGDYIQANERFRQAFEIRRVKNWFYRYAEAFRDARQYIYAERKYDELLRVYPRDKKGALDYAAMETHYIRNYEKADRIIRTNILDYSVNDREGLFALAENNLAWGEEDPSRYDEARAAYARLMEKYGRQDLYLEGMLKYFIRTDNLPEVFPLQAHFMSNPKKRKISVSTLAELGGYLLDKRLEVTEGVPDEYIDKIDGIKNILARAIELDRNYPESYYHLARYYNHYDSTGEERQILREAIRAFAAAPEESPRRAAYQIDAHRRYAEVLINAREFFSAEEELILGVRLYESARARQVLKNSSPEFGRLYSNLGDLEFFAKSGNMDAALRFYEEAERNGWSPPEIQYRMGVAHYQNEQWEESLRRFFALTSVMPNNKRLLYALGNTSYLRGNYFAAQGYYNRLMDLLDAERVRFPNLVPGSRLEEQDLTERLMVADNNLGVTLEALTRVSGDTSYRTRALYFFAESIRAWDVLTRNPESMIRMRAIKDLYGPGINLAYLNTQNILRPSPAYDQQIFMRIDKDSLEPSPWEILVPRDYQLSDQSLSTQAE